jgi:hypothetical protein
LVARNRENVAEEQKAKHWYLSLHKKMENE